MVHTGLAERQFGSRALPELGEPGQPSPTTPSRQLMEWVATAQRHGRVGAMEEYLAKHHLGSWHTTLNNHASTRPKMYGGPLVPAVSQCKTFEHIAPGSASAAAPGSASAAPGSTLVLLCPHFCSPWPCRGRCRVLHEDGWPCGYPCDLPKNHRTECMCVMHSPPEVDPVCMPCHACARPCHRT